MECVASHIGECTGLSYDQDTQTIGIKISTEANNSLVLGPDCGLFVAGEGVIPSPENCMKTVDSILAAGFFCGGRGGGSANLIAWATAEAIDYAIANDVDLIEAHAFALNDGVAAWSPVAADVATNVNFTSESTSAIRARSSQQYLQLTADPGYPGNPCGREARAPNAEKEDGGDGGYFGYHMPHYQPMLAHEAMTRISARAVTFLATGQAETETTLADINACIEAVNRSCNQSSAIIGISPGAMANANLITEAGQTACIEVNQVADVVPADVVASSATWVRIDGSMTDEYIASFVAAGLNVLVRTNARQFETERVQALEVAGIVSNDPVYACDKFGDGNGFLSFGGWSTHMGVLSYWTDQGNISSGIGYSQRSNQGLWVYNAPWIADDTPNAPGNWQVQHYLWGSIRSREETVPSFTMDLQLRWEYNNTPVTSLARSGVIFSCTNDVDYSGNDEDGLYQYAALRQGYIAYFGTNSDQPDASRMRIGRFDGTTFTQIASGPGGGRNIDDWIDFRLTVTATTISWERVGMAPITVEDSTYRGRFFGGFASNYILQPATFQSGFLNVNPGRPSALSSSDARILSAFDEPVTGTVDQVLEEPGRTPEMGNDT